MRLLVPLLVVSMTAPLLPAAAPQGGVTRFCVPSPQGATLTATGSADLTVNGGSGDLVLRADGLPQSTVGMFLYGDQMQAASPVGNGFLCVAGSPQIFRLGLLSTGPNDTSVSFALDYQQAPSPAAQILPGSSWNFKFWCRDGMTSDLADALQIEFGRPTPVDHWAIVADYTRSQHPLGQTLDGGVVVVNTDAEWDDLWALHWQGVPSAPPAPNVDMSTTTLIAAFSGRNLTSGYDMEVTAVQLSVSTLHVTTLKTQPGVGCGTFPSESQPLQIIAIRKVDGAILGEWTPKLYDRPCP